MKTRISPRVSAVVHILEILSSVVSDAVARTAESRITEAGTSWLKQVQGAVADALTSVPEQTEEEPASDAQRGLTESETVEVLKFLSNEATKLRQAPLREMESERLHEATYELADRIEGWRSDFVRATSELSGVSVVAGSVVVMRVEHCPFVLLLAHTLTSNRKAMKRLLSNTQTFNTLQSWNREALGPLSLALYSIQEMPSPRAHTYHLSPPPRAWVDSEMSLEVFLARRGCPQESSP